MKNSNQKGYATVLTIITIGLLGIVLFGLLNLHSLHQRKVQSNENSIKAYYIGESGIVLLKHEIDSIFKNYYEEYIDSLDATGVIEVFDKEDKVLRNYNKKSFKDYVLGMHSLSSLQSMRSEGEIFEFYSEPHGWKLEVVLEDDYILLYSTGHYKESRKRIVSLISYPDAVLQDEGACEANYRFIASEILSFYQGYEGESIE
jgi:hypothetical protein